VGPSSTAVTSTVLRRTVMVARPARRKLRSQSTSLKGAVSQRLSAPATTVTGVVYGRRLLRPRVVISALRSSGTPSARRNRAIGLNSGTQAGTLVAVSGAANQSILSCPLPYSSSDACIDRG